MTITSAASMALKNDLFLHHCILMWWPFWKSWGLWAFLNSYCGILSPVNCLHSFPEAEITVQVLPSSSFSSWRWMTLSVLPCSLQTNPNFIKHIGKRKNYHFGLVIISLKIKPNREFQYLLKLNMCCKFPWNWFILHHFPLHSSCSKFALRESCI